MENNEIKNNIFKFATKELSQDAFIAWLINSINYDDCELKKLAKDFETWKKQAKEKINDMKKGKLTENEVYNWILNTK